MAHAQKPDFVFRRNGRVHLNRRGRQFSRLLAAEVCASAVVMLDTPRSEVVWEYWLPTPFATFPFTSPPMRHRVPSGFRRTLQMKHKEIYGCARTGANFDLGNPLVRQLGRYLLWPRVGPVARSVNLERRVPAGPSRPPLFDGQVDQTNRARHWLAKHFSAALTGFTVIFLSCKVNARA